MKSHLLLPLLIFFMQNSFGQFKNSFASNGNPTTQIIDASGMKQGKWNYYDVGDKIFRIETYTDNVLTNNIFLLKGSEVNIMAYQQVQLSQLSTATIDFITKKLQPVGSGELVISSDGSVYLFFYLNKLKAKVPNNIGLESIKQLTLTNSIIKF